MKEIMVEIVFANRILTTVIMTKNVVMFIESCKRS